MKYLYSLIAAAALLVAGCVHLPSLYPPVSKNPTTKVTQVTKAPSAKAAVQSAFNWLAVLTILGGVACVGLGAYSIYRGLIVSGVKFILGGVLLPVAGIYIAYHWVLIVCLTLLAGAVYLTVTYWANLTPFLSKVEADVNPLLVKLGLVKAPATTAAATAASTTAAK